MKKMFNSKRFIILIFLAIYFFEIILIVGYQTLYIQEEFNILNLLSKIGLNNNIQLLLLNTAILAFYTWYKDNNLSEHARVHEYIESLNNFEEEVNIKIRKIEENIEMYKSNNKKINEGKEEEDINIEGKEEEDINIEEEINDIVIILTRIDCKLKIMPKKLSDKSIEVITYEKIKKIIGAINKLIEKHEDSFEKSILELNYYKNIIVNDLIELYPDKNIIKILSDKSSENKINHIIFNYKYFKKYESKGEINNDKLFSIYKENNLLKINYKNNKTIEVSEVENKVITNFKISFIREIYAKIFENASITTLKKQNVYRSDILYVENNDENYLLQDVIEDIIDLGDDSKFYKKTEDNNKDHNKIVGISVGKNRYFKPKENDCVIFTSTNWYKQGNEDNKDKKVNEDNKDKKVNEDNKDENVRIETWYTIPENGEKSISKDKVFYFIVRPEKYNPGGNADVNYIRITGEKLMDIKKEFVLSGGFYYLYLNWQSGDKKNLIDNRSGYNFKDDFEEKDICIGKGKITKNKEFIVNS